MASWMTGIVISAVNDRYMTRSPIVIAPVRIDDAADQHHRDADRADHQPSRTRVTADTPVSDLRDVPEQPVRALGEDQLFALLGGVGLDDADAAERFGEAAGHFGVDLAALAEQRPQPLERRGHAAAERAEDDDA